MDTDEKGRIYNQGYEAGLNHAEPSPQTKQYMGEIGIKMKHIEDKLALIPTRDEMKLFVQEAQEEILIRADAKFASKQTEKIVNGMVGTILLSVLLALIYLVVIR